MSEAACMSVTHPRRLSVLQQAIQAEVIFTSQDLLIPDTIEVFSSLQRNSSGRLGMVDGGQSCADELLRRHEVQRD